MNRHSCSMVLCGLAVASAFLHTSAAYASLGESCWPLRGPAMELVGYGEDYFAQDGRQLRHSGIDLEATAGDDVIACVAARVAFSGRVPSAAGSRLAVTLELPDSRRLTVSPLESLSVSAGDVVEAGRVLGRLAQAGDPSCTTPHLHVSLREAGEYVDPATLLLQPQPAEAAAVSAAGPSEPVGNESEPGPGAPVRSTPAVSTPVAPVTAESGAASVEPQPRIGMDSALDMHGGRIEEPQAHVQHGVESPRHTSMNVLAAERLHRDSLSPARDGDIWPVHDRRSARQSTSFPADLEASLLESAAAVSVLLLIIAGVGTRKRLSEVVSRRE